MSANLELLCAYAPADEADDDLPLIDLSGLRAMSTRIVSLWTRLVTFASRSTPLSA